MHKVTRFNSKDKASSYNRSLKDKISTFYYKLRYPIISLGKNTVIKKNVEFKLTDGAKFHQVIIARYKEYAYFILTKPNPQIEIGNYSGIGRNCYFSIKDKLTIGNYVRFGPDVCVIDQDHGYSKDNLIMNQKATIKGIEIEDDVWIGRGVTILKGVKISKGAIIGANVLVNRDVGSYEIWGGVLAKKISERK